jgi:hypothetical protein
MRPILLAILLLAASAAGLAQNATTALTAIKLLPKGEAKKVARIEAREGNPNPERWYILVHNPADEAGLHEYVVAGGAVVASRALSQFAESVKADEVFGSEPVKVDSDRAVRVAQQYAQANKVEAASFSYQLHKDAEEGAPVWSVTCLDPAGKALGGVVLTASKGTVLSHTGFAVEPTAEKSEKAEKWERRKADDDEESTRQARSKRYVVRRGPAPMRQQPPPPPPKANFFERMFGGR